MRIVKQIVAGTSSSTVHIGGTAFLGVQIDASSGYSQIEAVVPGGAADAAGLQAGDVITAIGGRAVSSSTSIADFLFTKHPGDRVTVTLDDGYGSTRTATVTLGSGPPQ
jgi:S1-C subfamily serine protease